MSRRTKRIQRARKTNPRYRSSRSLRTVWLVALILVSVFGVGFIAVEITSELAPWQLSDEISPNDARKEIGSGAVVLDVRTHDDFVAGHIEKSLWMPLEELPSLMQALPRDRLIITVCNTGLRSIQARYILQEDGFTQVTSLKGGLNAWVDAGFQVVYGEPVRNN